MPAQVMARNRECALDCVQHFGPHLLINAIRSEFN